MEHARARVLPFRPAVADGFSGEVIDRIVSAQREKFEREIARLKAEAEKVAEEARELVGEVPF